MQERVSTVESLIHEHEAIRGHLKQVRESVKNLEIFLVQESSIFGQSDYFTVIHDKQQSLKQAMGYLEDGLRTHHQHEDSVMPPLVGGLLMQAIRLEHLEMLDKLNNIRPLLMEDNMERFLQKAAYVQKEVEGICQLSSTHSVREDGILYFLRRVP